MSEQFPPDADDALVRLSQSQHEAVEKAEPSKSGEVNESRLSERAQKWLVENAEAIECWNEYVAKHGLPLARYRNF